MGEGRGEGLYFFFSRHAATKEATMEIKIIAATVINETLMGMSA